MKRHYDAVVMGGSLGALAAAAVLARRSFRVLVVGQGYRPRAYRYDGLCLMRRPSTFLAGTTPAWRRITSEIASGPLGNRRDDGPPPRVQLLLPGARLALSSDLRGFVEEAARAYGPLRRAVERLAEDAAQRWAALERPLSEDVVFRGGTFFERRKATQVRALLARATEVDGRGTASDVPAGHDLQRAMEALVSFASGLPDGGAGMRDRALLLFSRLEKVAERNEERLVTALIDRIGTLGGDVRLSERVSKIDRRGRRVAAVSIDGDESPVGCEFVISDLGVRGLLDLAPDLEPSPALLDELPPFWTVGHKFVMSVLVRDDGVPELAGTELIAVPPPASAEKGPNAPPLAMHIERLVGGKEWSAIPPGHQLLVVECVLRGTLENELEDARERVLSLLERQFPFIERHYVVVDSPHDGRPVWDYRDGSRRDEARQVARAGGGSLEAEPMTALWALPGAEPDDTVGEPVRTPLHGALAIGPRALPRFGQEGELLAALSAAHIVTKADPGREKIRRAIWRRTDLG